MTCKQPIPAVIGCKPPALAGHVRAHSLAAALTLGAGVALSVVTAAGSWATAQELQWATSAGGAGFDAGEGIATDGHGNSYVTGSFSGTAKFGEGEDNDAKLSAAGDTDIFVAKYDRNGLLVWAKRAGGPGASSARGGEVGLGIATDGRGNSYVTGLFQSTAPATFGEGEANETVLTGDSFVAKYDRDGMLVWARALSSGFRYALGVAADREGNSYVTGCICFRPGNVPNQGFIFVAKYDRNGRLLWERQARNFGGFGADTATDGRGNSYVTGQFLETVTFGAGEDNETVLGGPARTRLFAFVAKYDRNGLLVWAKQEGAAQGTGAAPHSNFTQGTGIATDAIGNSYVTGTFDGAETFGAGEDNETVLNASGVFVAKYDPNGRLVWAKRVGGGGHDFYHVAESPGIAIDRHGNSYVTGTFSGTETFGAGEDHETVLNASGDLDVFVAKYDPNGRLIWATQAGGIGGSVGSDIATDGRGISYVTGYFGFATSGADEVGGTARFGAGEDKETVLEAVGSADVFVAKYGGGTNERDQCPDSDLQRDPVVIDGINTGVENALTDTGCTILDLILRASDDAADRAEFIREVALLTRTLLRDGLITAEEAGIIRTAASQATFPLS